MGDREGITLTQAARMLGVLQHRLIHYCEKGVVVPDLEDAQGRGSSRRFSAMNLFEFSVEICGPFQLKVQGGKIVDEMQEMVGLRELAVVVDASAGGCFLGRVASAEEDQGGQGVLSHTRGSGADRFR